MNKIRNYICMNLIIVLIKIMKKNVLVKNIKNIFI